MAFERLRIFYCYKFKVDKAERVGFEPSSLSVAANLDNGLAKLAS
jgi:hypothetical protein